MTARSEHIGVVGFSYDGNSFSVKVDLKPSCQYQFVSTDRTFRSEDGYPLVSLNVNFKQNNSRMITGKTLRTCTNGHQYHKSSDSPTCPVCEAEKKSTEGFLALLSAPARRALEGSGIRTVKQLSSYSEKELLKLHGVGPSSIPKLKRVLQQNGLDFKK